MSNAARSTQPYGALASPGRVRLTVVAGPCPEGMTFALGADSVRIGRGDTEVSLGEDNEVSPLHAVLSSRDGRVVITDKGSTNGVFLRARVPHVLQEGSWFRTGDQFFRLHLLQQAENYPAPDGTLLFTSPRRKGTFRVQQILAGGLLGQSATTSNDELTIGGEGSSVAFASDPHLSAKHARIYRAANGMYMIEDAGSKNGTFVRIQGEAPLSGGDYLFVGATLLRVDVT